MNAIQLRNYTIFLVITFCILFNYGFMKIRIGGVIPIAELVLIFSLLTIRYTTLIPRLSSVVCLIPFFIWWFYGICYALLGIPKYGIWALRDASHVIESLFLLLGFSYIARPKMREKFFKWLPIFLVITSLYALSFAFSLNSFLIPYAANDFTGDDISIFLTYSNSGSMLLLSASYLFIFKAQKRNFVLYYFLAMMIFFFAIFLFQSRTIYLQSIFLFVLLLLYKKISIVKVLSIIILLIPIFMLLSLADINLKGRLQIFSFDFLINHLMTLSGDTNSPELEGSAGGVSQRIEWWLNLFEIWTKNVINFIFGLGYGFPLIDFINQDSIIVREPHNSYISVLARGGVLAAVMFLWMHVLLLRTWKRLYFAYGHCGDIKGQYRLIVLMVFFLLVWIQSIGEDGFEKPYYAIPYYFFWGIILRLSYNKKNLIN